MKYLIEKVSEISNKYQHLAEVSGDNFNVFSVINVTTDEVRLHSRFIAELLNPKGSHGQGAVFLQIFIDKFSIKLDTASVRVRVEEHIGTKTETNGGYLDIYVFDNRGANFIIENKIYAPDQDNQLLRYYNFKKDNILYLTLFGDAPSKNSYGSLKIDVDFKLISYHDDIKDWLAECRKEAVELPLLREGISHYINLIETITGQSSNDIMNDEIRDYISSTSDNLKQAALIEENMMAAKVKIQWSFWVSLEKKIIQYGLILVEKDSLTWQNVNGYYTKSRNRDTNYGFWIKVYEKDSITIHFGIEVENQIFCGFTLERNGKGSISKLPENTNFKNLVLDLNDNYINNEHWLGWRFLNQKLDFRAFNSEAIFALADRNNLEKTTDEIVKDILKDINELKTKLENI